MKKLFIRCVALCSAAIMLLVFSSCNSDKKVTPTDVTTTTNPYIENIEELAVKEDLKDAAGAVVFSLDIVLPQLAMDSFEYAGEINSVFALRVEEFKNFAKNNIENASDFMSRNANAQPWVCKVRYSITYRDAKYLCVLSEYTYGMGTADRSRRLESDCFMLDNGRQCRAEDFLPEGAKMDDIYNMIADRVISDMTNNVGELDLLPDMTREKVIEVKKEAPRDFYLTAEGITFYFQLAAIAPYDKGILEYSFEAVELQGLLDLPMAS